jgi:hypothetical protein
MKRSISLTAQELADLKGSGHCVDHSGIVYKVGATYLIKDGQETLKVKCTQDCPNHLILLP